MAYLIILEVQSLVTDCLVPGPTVTVLDLDSWSPVSWFCAHYHNTLFAFEHGLLRMRSMICHLQSYFEK